MTVNVNETPKPGKSRKRVAENTTSNAEVLDLPEGSRAKRRKNKVEVPGHIDRVSSPWKIGAHVSAAGGIENSVRNAAAVGANAFALFPKSQRKWTSPPLSSESVKKFKEQMKAFGYSPSHVLPHGSYLINLGNPDEAKRDKSHECFLDDLQRCEQLGLELYNFHPGSTVGQASKDESISYIAASLNKAHKATSSVVTVIENMAGSGNVIGSLFEDLADIIGQIDDKSRVGVCLDTCHMFAAGYDITTKEGWNKIMSDFDSQIGLSYLKGLHINDSKTPLGSKKDRHENIGMGHLGLHSFHHIVTDIRLQNIPLVLETPSFEITDIWAKEIEVLNRLSGLTEDDGAAFEEWAEEIKKVVQSKSNSKPTKKSQGRGRTKNKKDELSEDDKPDDV